MNKNRAESRVCHTCKGRLMVDSSTYVYSKTFDKTSYFLELKCYRCNVLYILKDDRLLYARVNDVLWQPPFIHTPLDYSAVLDKV